jgi:hypothetical protein
MEGYFLKNFRPNRARPMSPTPNNSTLAGSGTEKMIILFEFCSAVFFIFVTADIFSFLLKKTSLTEI